MDPFAYLDSLGMFRMRPGLSRIRMLSKELGSPEASIPSVLVAGTNGKGSTCYMAGSIMESMGFRTLVYTSPHMISPAERFLIGGEEVKMEDLGRSIGKVRSIAERIDDPQDRPTYFEVLTACAFDLAREKGVDCIVSEVGLGGRFDATNILAPAACAITSISLDHTDVLGDDVRTISTEKAGIVKASTPLVLGPLSGAGDEAVKVRKHIIGICSQNGSPVVAIHRDDDEEIAGMLSDSDIPDWRTVKVTSSTGRDGCIGEFEIGSPRDPVQEIPLLRAVDMLVPGKYSSPIPGGHQALNMASALSLSSLLLPYAICMKNIRAGAHEYLTYMLDADPDPLIRSYGEGIVVQGLSEGLRSARPRNRFEIVEDAGRTIVLDGGHNEEAAEGIARTFAEVFPGSKAHFLIAMSREKDPIGFLSNILPLVKSMTITTASSERGMPLSSLLGASSIGGGSFPIRIREDRSMAIREWLGSVKEGEIGMACGTFYLYAKIKEKLHG